MFTITKMSPRSEDYLLGPVRYYRIGRRRKKKGPRNGTCDDDSPDIDPDGDKPGFSDSESYSIDIPGEPPLQWAGSGAVALGLSGIVYEEHYRRAFHGYHPSTGKPLVQNAGKPNRRPGWECCFSAPKDVSVLWSQLSLEDKILLQKIVWRAVLKTLKMIEERFAFSRAGKASEGCKYIPGGMVEILSIVVYGEFFRRRLGGHRFRQ